MYSSNSSLVCICRPLWGSASLTTGAADMTSVTSSRAKTPKGKFSTPFKSPASSIATSQRLSQESSRSCFPDDGLDDSLLWYPEDFTKSISRTVTQSFNTSTPVQAKNAVNKLQPVKTTAKSKSQPKATIAENAMPDIPKVTKTPTRIARIIPKTPTKKSTASNTQNTPKRKRALNSPRIPTFQMYGVKSPFSKPTPTFSQQSTPGLTQNTLLRKLSERKNIKQKKGLGNDGLDFHADNEGEQAQYQGDVVSQDGDVLNNHEVIADDMDVPARSVPLHENTKQYIENQTKNLTSGSKTSQEDINEQQYGINQYALPKDVYNFRLSPNSQRMQHRRNRKAVREVSHMKIFVVCF